MEKANVLCAIFVLFVAFDACATNPLYSSRLIHRFSDEAKTLWASKFMNDEREKTASWPEKKSFLHMRVLFENDLKRQRLRLDARNQTLVASQGGQTCNYGNDMGWYVLFTFYFLLKHLMGFLCVCVLVFINFEFLVLFF